MVDLPHRLVLQDVPQVNFYEGGPRCPEDICFPSVLRAITEYLGDPDYGCHKCRDNKANCPISCSYAFFVGVSGAAFYISWKDGWSEDNQAFSYLDSDSTAMEQHAFKAMGYSYDLLMPNQCEQFLPRIAESLRRGVPAISYGIVGPPEPGLITGYDDEGETILGWNFFEKFDSQIERDPSGYFRKRDWAQGAQSILIIGEKGARPALKDTYRESLEFALRIIRTPMVRPEPEAPAQYRHRHNGLAAYDAWASHLLRDEDFATKDEAILRKHYEVHDQMVGMIAEARWYGSRFLAGMTEHIDNHIPRDAIEPILHAAALYAGDHALMWRLWDLAGGLGNPEGWKLFADSGVRRQMASLIEEVKCKDRAAADQLELALTCWQ